MQLVENMTLFKELRSLKEQIRQHENEQVQNFGIGQPEQVDDMARKQEVNKQRKQRT